MIPGMFPKVKRQPTRLQEPRLSEVNPVPIVIVQKDALLASVEVGEYLDEFSSPKKGKKKGAPSRPEVTKTSQSGRKARRTSTVTNAVQHTPFVKNLEAEISLKRQQVTLLRDELGTLREEHTKALTSKDRQIEGLLLAIDRVGSSVPEAVEEPTIVKETFGAQERYFKEEMERELSLKDQQVVSTQKHLEETEKELQRVTIGLSSGGTARQRMIEISLREELEEEKKKADARVEEIESTIGEALKIAERNIKYNETLFKKSLAAQMAEQKKNYEAKIVAIETHLNDSSKDAHAEITERDSRLEELKHRLEIQKELGEDNLDRAKKMHKETMAKFNLDHQTSFRAAIEQKENEHNKQLRVLQLKQSLAIRELNKQLDKGLKEYKPLLEKNREMHEQLALLGAIDDDEIETGAWGRRSSLLEDTKISVSDLEKKLDDAIVQASEKYPNQYRKNSALIVRSMGGSQNREDVD